MEIDIKICGSCDQGTSEMMRRKGRRLRRTPMQRAHEKESGQHSKIKLRGEAGRQKTN